MNIDTILVKVASKCNINCTYCYVYNMGDNGWRDMPALMSRSTISLLSTALAELVEDQDRPFAVVLHGGEPLMLGAQRLYHLFDSVRAVLPPTHPLCIQTNGLLITDEIANVCAEFRVGISVSLDGPKEVNDRFRVGKRGDSTHEMVVKGIDILRNHAQSDILYSGLLCVINPFSNPVNIYQYFKTLGAPCVDFLYRDGNHTCLPFGKAAYKSTEYGDWLARLFEFYVEDANPIRIRILDDIVKMCLGGKGVKEGVGERDYGIIIVETDGTISKNDTLKSAFPGADRFERNWRVGEHRLSAVLDDAEFRKYHSSQRPTSIECRACKYAPVCGGGMPLHRWSAEDSFDNPSVYCSDQKVVINAVLQRLLRENLPVDARLF